MRSFIPLTALLAVLPQALAHWNYASLIVNGEETEDYQYVRSTKNSNSPVTDVTSDDIICNVGGIDADVMSATETHKVAPGDEVGFVLRDNFGHPGPQQVYMSKAPGAAKEYKGGGDWFKVYSLTTSSISEDEGAKWAAFDDGGSGITNFTFALPDNLEAGEYLLRAEGIGLHGAGEKGGAQFYIGCAQLEVTGSGSGSPAPTVKFPGAYTGDEPGILIGIYYPPVTNYTAPGPAVWPGECEDHTANLAGGESDGDCTASAGASEGASSN